MSEDEQLEMLIEQTINGAITAIPAQLEEIKQSKDILKVENPNEFVFGIIMGMALGMAGALMTAQKGIPTLEDQLKVRDLVYKKIPDIRAQIFK
ncbi:MAG TPA: hypothetical protein VLA01_01685 [Nitrosopumilaceae archaeon]|nr:hypothetical protein [Nitrosopumilaceae archaeon]